jgi:dihydroflavonol-4-reductase
MGNLRHFYDSRRAESELGYQRRPLSETLRDAWEWLQQQHR